MTPTKQKILALDLGQHTGWAMQQDNGRIVYGSMKFQRGKNDHFGTVWLKFSLWIEDMIQPGKIDLVVYENVCGHNGAMAAHWYGGFWSHVEAAAAKAKVPCRSVGVKTIKQAVCGSGNAGKIDVIKAMQTVGHNPMNDNEADALAVLHWAIGNFSATQ